MQKKIVITGGPGTGKTTLINKLVEQGFYCMPEISREITAQARLEGVEYLFLSQPILFSERLLKGRIAQYNELASRSEDLVFFDRGIPDVSAYMDCTNEAYPEYFTTANKDHPYTQVFILPPWEEIFVSDDIRFEDFEYAVAIYHALKKAYTDLGYQLIEIPKTSVDERISFILKHV